MREITIQVSKYKCLTCTLFRARIINFWINLKFHPTAHYIETHLISRERTGRDRCARGAHTMMISNNRITRIRAAQLCQLPRCDSSHLHNLKRKVKLAPLPVPSKPDQQFSTFGVTRGPTKRARAVNNTRN